MTFDLPTLIAIRARLEQHAALSIFSGGPGVSPDRCRRILGWLGPVGGDITVRHYLWPNRQPEPKFTPGPWFHETSGMIFDANGIWVASAEVIDESYRHTASLIAAAPDMWGALMGAISVLERFRNARMLSSRELDVLSNARAALSKAGGRDAK